MLQMQHHQSSIEKRLHVIGIPAYMIRPIADLFIKWEKSSGVEWTIQRLKSLKVDLIRRRAGHEPITWIRRNSSGDVRGPLGSLFRWSDKSDKNFSRAVQVLMAYTYYILPEISPSQEKKFMAGINSSTSDGLSEDFSKSFSRSVKRILPRRPVGGSHRPLVSYSGSPSKKAPSMFGRKSKYQDQSILDDLQVFNTPGGSSIYARYQRLYQPLLRGIEGRRAHLDYIATNYRSLTDRGFDVSQEPVQGGEIHFIQEPGGKLRSVASPLRIHQEALRPLGEAIYDVVRSLPWDCTFEQSKAQNHIQSCLRQGRQVHSVDLSSATDHFPLSLQMTALRAIFHSDDWDHLDLFQEISRGTWKSKLGWLSWLKGQPLGLYPSFGSFTLTHGLLLYHLAGSYENQFFVLGDDVVILDDDLAQRYMTMLDRMSCPYSLDKSLSSSQLAEFAGKIYTETEVIPQLKWRQMSNDNFLDLCRMLGKKSRCLLTDRQKIVFDQVEHLCEPVGLNFSFPGSNLSTMVYNTLNFYQPELTVLGALMGLRSRINNVVYSSSETFSSVELEEIATTFDEKVKSVLSQTIFSRWESSLSLGLSGLETIPSALGLSSRLPTKVVQPTRLTTLDRYEKMISF